MQCLFISLSGLKFNLSIMYVYPIKTSIIPSYLWICSTADLPWLSKINSRLLGSVWLVDCPTSAEVNVVLQAFVNRIQKL
jgi:hypothetical protein